MLAPSVQHGSAWPSLKPSATHGRRGLASGTGPRAQVLTGALAPRSPVSSSSPAAAMTAAATVSAAVTETASSSAGTAASQPVANKHDTSTSIWGSGPAGPRSTRGSGADTPASHDNSSRRDSLQNMFLSALASSGPAPFGPMFTPPLLAGAGAGGLAVNGPGYLTSGSAAASAAWQPRRHLSNTSAAALPTLRVPARSSPSQQSRSAGGATSTQQQREAQPAASPSSPSAAAAEFVAAATNQAAAATAAAIRTAIQAAAAVGAAGGAAPDIHIHGGWLGVARQVAAGLSALSFVSGECRTVTCRTVTCRTVTAAACHNE